MSDTDSLSKNSAQSASAPVAALSCPDLMFLVRLQGMARASGYEPRALGRGGTLEGARVLVLNLAGNPGWEGLVRQAAEQNIPTIAFGPHLDAESRKRAKEAGASRVLANSNLERDLPRLLRELDNDVKGAGSLD
jgi:hypothetical protein